MSGPPQLLDVLPRDTPPSPCRTEGGCGADGLRCLQGVAEGVPRLGLPRIGPSWSGFPGQEGCGCWKAFGLGGWPRCGSWGGAAGLDTDGDVALPKDSPLARPTASPVLEPSCRLRTGSAREPGTHCLCCCVGGCDWPGCVEGRGPGRGAVGDWVSLECAVIARSRWSCADKAIAGGCEVQQPCTSTISAQVSVGALALTFAWTRCFTASASDSDIVNRISSTGCVL